MSHRITIADPSADWPRLFQEEKARLLEQLGPRLWVVEHMGSTAIPGLAAKPIIDVLAAVTDLAEVAGFIEPLRALGYEYVSRFESEIPERRFFQKHAPDGARTHHLHIYDRASFYGRPERVFRDYVRDQPEVAEAYAALKRDLAARLGDDRAAYTEAKTTFIQSVTARAFIHLNVTLEYALDAREDMVPFPGSTEQAQYIVYRYLDDYGRYFRHDLPASVRAQLAALPPALAFESPETVQALVAPTGPAPWIGAAYTLSRAPDANTFPEVIQDGERFVINVDGATVAVAWSVRSNARVAEVAVETLPAFRRRGLGRQVTAAWLYHTLVSGRLPFFSHAREHVASAALAHSLGLSQFAEGAAYT